MVLSIVAASGGGGDGPGPGPGPKPNYLSKTHWTLYSRAMLDSFPQFIGRKHWMLASTNQCCKFNHLTFTTFTSSLYVATLVASLSASWITSKLGPKISMLLGGLIFLIGTAINAGAQAVWMLI
ncbi:sugar transporter, putative [Ricinus communis]|uniref:Sugar transporter, putative n=1 Tax=Ricinus communis TaxID=3988 RepID=B9T6V0_RICCO|nr:sugar transporter, putative [Ricinus communis]